MHSAIRTPWTRGVAWLGDRALGKLMARSAGATFAIGALGSGLGLLVAALLARSLGRAGYGTYAWAMALATSLGVVASLGTGLLVVREVAVYRSRAQWSLLRGLLRRVAQGLAASSVLIMIVTGLVAIFVYPRGHGALMSVLGVGILLVPALALTLLAQAVMQGLGRTVAAAAAVSLRPLLVALVVTAFYLTRPQSLSARAAVGFQVLAAVLALGVVTLLLLKSLPTAARRAEPAFASRHWLRGAAGTGAAAGALALDAPLGILILGALRPRSDVGSYAAAIQVSLVLTLIVAGVQTPLAPILARLHADGSSARLQRGLTRGARSLAAIVAVVAGVLALLATPILSVYGPAFVGAAGALRLLCVGQVCNAVGGFNILLLLMANRQRQAALAAGVGTATNLVLCIALVPAFGINGAALAWLGGTTSRNVISSWQAWKYLRLDPTAPAAFRAMTRIGA
jgi:O-antigen/teichoic acid export membrane protein